MNWILGIPAIILLIIGLVGQAFEMRKIRITQDVGSPTTFMDKRNIKWYAIIGTALILWFMAERN